MEQIGQFVTRRAGLATAFALAAAIAAAVAAAAMADQNWQNSQLAQLQLSAERKGNEILSLTLSGRLMGAISLTGLTDDEIKQKGMSRQAPNTPDILRLFETIGQAFDAEGVFVVSADGIIRASWNASDTPTTGLNVGFRPYFHSAMRGTENIYAAVRLNRDDRSLYFAAPIYATASKDASTVGAIVARTALDRVDSLLNGSAPIALLLSPQDIVFAGNRQEWVGRLVGTLSPERLKAIRDLRQFGDIFEARNPVPLLIPTTDGIAHFEGADYAVSMARINWNDPAGDWQLVLMEDLSRTRPISRIIGVALVSGAVAGIIALLLVNLLRSLQRQNEANRKIREFAATLELHAEQRERIASLSLRLQQTGHIEALGQIVLSEAHALLDMQQGVIYAADSDAGTTLRCIASYACATAPPDCISFGEGLLGQCAVDRRPITIKATNETLWHIRSGLGEAAPGCVTIQPIMLNQNLVGVVEIALPDLPDDHQSACLDAILPVLAMNMEIRRQYGNAEKQRTETATVAHEAERSEDHSLFNRRIRELQSEANAFAVAAGLAMPYPTVDLEAEDPPQPQARADDCGDCVL